METANLSFGDESSFEDMLKELASKLSDPVANYYQPNRHQFVCDILTNQNPSRTFDDWQWYETIENYYVVPMWHGFEIPVGKTVILHGHDREHCCYAGTFCHEYGYKPTGGEHPKFLANFYKKWPYLK